MHTRRLTPKRSYFPYAHRVHRLTFSIKPCYVAADRPITCPLELSIKKGTSRTQPIDPSEAKLARIYHPSTRVLSSHASSNRSIIGLAPNDESVKLSRWPRTTVGRSRERRGRDSLALPCRGCRSVRFLGRKCSSRARKKRSYS